jgi:RsiW-degrading membrane proteinase PrsW (M82 family)
VIFYLYRNGSKMDWRGACVWGLASGVGFGVSEGISYAGGMYNGIMLYDIYLIRFISCVALHGIWSAAVGLSPYRNREDLRRSRWTILKICIVPMILHGLYDTLLKMQYPGGAVLCAIAGFGWLAYQFECTYAEYGSTSEEAMA